jgi:hypothetical protein
MLSSPIPEVYAPVLFTQVRGKKRNSRKFAVASDPPSSAVSTPRRHFAAPSASKRGDLVAFVAPLCIKLLRLVTALLPEKFLLGPGLKRTPRC